jgi:hypothetical protein
MAAAAIAEIILPLTEVDIVAPASWPLRGSLVGLRQPSGRSRAVARPGHTSSLYPYTAAFSSFAALKAIFLLAAI